MTPVRSYRDLEIYQQAFDLAVQAHEATMQLPRYELHETGSQLRRAAKSIPANIYVRFLTFALASCDEVRVHLDVLHATGNLSDATHHRLSQAYDTLGRHLSRFLQSVLREHKEPYR